MKSNNLICTNNLKVLGAVSVAFACTRNGDGMNKMDRRSFLKGMGYTAAVVAGEAAAGKQTRTGVAYGSEGNKTGMYSTVADHGMDRASFDFYTDHKSRLVAAGPGDSEREAVFDISVNPISLPTCRSGLRQPSKAVPRGFALR